jgi:hypothetical protein
MLASGLPASHTKWPMFLSPWLAMHAVEWEHVQHFTKPLTRINEVKRVYTSCL